MVNFGYPYSDLVICKASPDYLAVLKFIWTLVFEAKFQFANSSQENKKSNTISEIIKIYIGLIDHHCYPNYMTKSL